MKNSRRAVLVGKGKRVILLNHMKKWLTSFQHLPLFFLLICIAAWWFLTQVVFPPLFSQYSDPELAYLFSTLNLLERQPVVYIDHPGTPLQILGVFFLSLSKLLMKTGGTPFVFATIQNPYPFFFIARAFIVLINTAAIFQIYQVFRKGKEPGGTLFAAAIAGLYFMIHPGAFQMLTVWSHNSFNFAGGSLLLAFLYLAARRDSALRTWEVIAFSFAAGVLCAVTVYLGSWMIGIAGTIFLKSVARKGGFISAAGRVVLSGLGFGAGFVAATLPILPSYPKFFEWIYQLLIHQERYGAGPVGMVPAQVLLTRLGASIAQSPGLLAAFIFYVLTAACLGMVWIKKRRTSSRLDGETAFFIAVSIQLLFNIFIILKHPLLIYWLSVAATLPILIGTGLDRLRRENFFSAGFLRWTGLVGLLIFAGVFLRSLNTYLGLRSSIIQVENSISAGINRLAVELQINRGEMRILRTYGTFSPCYALWFGNNYSGGAFSNEIREICPGDFSLSVFDQSITSVGEYHPSEWDVIVSRAKFSETGKIPYNHDAHPVIIDAGNIPDGYGPFVVLRTQPDEENNQD